MSSAEKAEGCSAFYVVHNLRCFGVVVYNSELCLGGASLWEVL